MITVTLSKACNKDSLFRAHLAIPAPASEVASGKKCTAHI